MASIRGTRSNFRARIHLVLRHLIRLFQIIVRSDKSENIVARFNDGATAVAQEKIRRPSLAMPCEWLIRGAFC
jgi:hypothetical protein